MTEPIKISEQGRALTCDEYDNNLDILRDRSNHTGTQSCNTITDLDNCLVTSTTIGTINTSINNVTSRIVNLENTLSASGSIANDLNSLEAILTADINENRASITSLETNFDNLEVRVSGVESNLVSLTNVVNTNNTTTNTTINNLVNTNNNQDTRLTNVENRATTLNANILTEAATRQSAVNNLQSEIDAEEINRINADTNLTTALDNEEAERILADDTLTNNLTVLSTNLINTANTDRNNRIAADADLQLQLNNLLGSINSAIPTGTVLPYIGNFNTIPTGFLLCAGAAISRSTYITLFTRIGTRYGTGNGTTTFNLPDFRDKIMYGSFNGTLDSTPIQVGSNSVTLTINNLPAHTHTTAIPIHTHTVGIQHDHALTIAPHTHTTGPIGSHGHSLNPYRQVAFGGGGEDDSGAELTFFPSDTVNIYPNTAVNNAPGPVVNPTSVVIFEPPWQGISRTNTLTSDEITRETNANVSTTVTSSSQGSSVPVDTRQDSLRVNYIVKT